MRKFDKIQPFFQILRAQKFMITLQYECDLLRVSHLPYDTIQYDIQKTHYAYPYCLL
jgi:hypothetical protein